MLGLVVLQRVVDVVGLNQVDDSHALLVLERNLLLVDLEGGQLVHVGLVHPSLEAADEVAVQVDGVLDVVDAVLQLLLEVLRVVVAQLLLVVADRVEHRSELFKFLPRSNVKISKVLDVHLLVDVIAVVVSESRLELDIVACIVFIQHVGSLLSFFGVLAEAPDHQDEEPVQEVADQDGDRHPENDLCRGDVIATAEESVWWLLGWSVMYIDGVVLWRQQSLVGEHEANHDQVDEHSILDEVDCIDRHHLVEVVGLSEIGEEQPLPNPVTDEEVKESEHIHEWHAPAVHVVNEDVCEEPGVWEEGFNEWTRVKLVKVILEILLGLTFIIFNLPLTARSHSIGSRLPVRLAKW